MKLIKFLLTNISYLSVAHLRSVMKVGISYANLLHLVNE